MIAWLQLFVGTAVLLAPGWAIGRGAAEAFTWSVGLVAAALAITFAVHGSLLLTLALVLAAGAVALVVRRKNLVTFRHKLIVLCGLALGGAVWFIEGIVRGDALFHLARMR